MIRTALDGDSGELGRGSVELRCPIKSFIAGHKKSRMTILRVPRYLLEKEEIEEIIAFFPEACQDATVYATSSIFRIRGLCTFAYGRSNDAGTSSNRTIHRTENVLTAHIVESLGFYKKMSATCIQKIPNNSHFNSPGLSLSRCHIACTSRTACYNKIRKTGVR